MEFEITSESRAFSRADKTWGEEPGDFKVYAGHSSKADLSAEFTVKI